MNAVCAAAILLTVSICLSWVNAQDVVYAQVGMSTKLPIEHKAESGYYVYWYFWQNIDRVYQVYNRHGLGAVSINPNWTNRVSINDQDDSLIINNVKDSDFGFYKFEKKGRQTDSTEKLYQLYRVTLSPPATVLRGDSLSLNCNVEKSGISTVREWIPPKTLDNKQFFSRSSENLFIQNLSWRHQGFWTCSVKYNKRTADARTMVHVLDLPPSPEEPIYTSTGSSLHLPCSVSSSVEWAVVLNKGFHRGSWNFRPAADSVGDPGEPLQLAFLPPSSTPRWNLTAGRGLDGSALEKGTKGSDLSLIKKAVTVKDRGNYTCALGFRTVSLERTLRVEVLQVVARPEPRAFESQRLNLSCTLGHSLAPGSGLEVKWFPPKDASLSTLESTPHPETLSLEASILHRGRWRCELRKGNKTLTSAYISLEIAKAPVDVWLWVGIASTGLIVILLIFIGRTLIRRHRQRTTQRRKPRFCCCNNPKPPKGFYRT